MRQIKMLKTAAGAEGVRVAGSVFWANDVTAQAMVKGGAAEYVEQPKPRVVDKVEEVEEATVAAPERAVKRRVKRRRKKK